MKTVSIYIPTHNRPEFLDRALLSLTTQSMQGFQVLICDDGSSKENKKKISNILHRYKGTFSDLVFFDLEQPKGACYARNLMINAADGEFITGLDDDDEFCNNRLECFFASTELHKYSYLSSGLLVNDGVKKSPFIQVKGATTLDRLLFSNIVGNQVFTRTEYLKALGGFDESFPSWQDYDLWVRLTSQIGPGYKIQDCTYILNTDHEMGRITNSKRVQDGHVKFIEKHATLLNPKQLNSLQVQNLINSSAQPDIKFLINTAGIKSTLDLINYWLKKDAPATSALIRRLINLTKK